MKKEEFISIIRDHRNLIYKICNSYCSDREGRKDLEQEILMQLWSSISRFDGRVKISTWIYRVALNTAISFYRQGCNHNGRKVSIDAMIISPTHHVNAPEQDENIALLYRFIENLNEMDKALMLLYLDDCKYKDIAEILGISETNVATKINRIKKDLKEKFNNY